MANARVTSSASVDLPPDALLNMVRHEDGQLRASEVIRSNRALQESLSQTVSFSVETAVEYARTMASQFRASSCVQSCHATDIFMQDMRHSSWEFLSLFTAHFLSGLLKLSTPSLISSEMRDNNQDATSTLEASTVPDQLCTVPTRSHGAVAKLEMSVDEPRSSDKTSNQKSHPGGTDAEEMCIDSISLVRSQEMQAVRPRKHDLRPRKDVPPIALYTFRGVMCKICFERFKGKSCVEALVDHTKLQHATLATERYIRQIRQANSFKRLIRNGIPYCTCDFCQLFGLASLKDSA